MAVATIQFGFTADVDDEIDRETTVAIAGCQAKRGRAATTRRYGHVGGVAVRKRSGLATCANAGAGWRIVTGAAGLPGLLAVPLLDAPASRAATESPQ